MNRPKRRTAIVALAATLAIQVFTSLAATSPAVLAPALAQDLGVASKWIGVFVGLVYAGAMLGSLVAGGLIVRHGAIRVSQVCVLLCAAGIVFMAALPAAAVGLVAAAAVLIGFGYGPITPASSQVLARTTPPAQMALMFSIKQTGVPAGTALAGAVLPAIALLFGWRAAFVGIGVLGILVVLAAQPTRAMLDHDLQPDHRLTLRGAFAGLRNLLRTRILAELVLLSFAYAAVQVCLTSFLVVFLHDALGWSLVLSGLALTCATMGGVVGRIVWGAIADGVLAPRRTLSLIGILAGLAGLALAYATPLWPVSLLLALATVYGATAIGWNGVQLSELARRAPPGTAAVVTGAAGFVTFSGVVLGPPLFAVLSSLVGYRAGFLFCAALSLAAAIGLALRGTAGVGTTADRKART